MEKVLRNSQKGSKLLTVRDGYLVCPVCRQNKKLKPIGPGEYAERCLIYCPKCKNRVTVNIVNGQCFESPCL